MQEIKTIPERATQTKMLVALLRSHEEGDFVSYEELSRCIGENVQTAAYGYMRRARKIVLTEDAARWEPVRGEGLKSLNASESISACVNTPRRVRRLVRREKKKLTAIDYKRLNNEERERWNLVGTYIAFVDHVSKDKSQEKLLEGVRHSNNELPPAKAIEVLRGYH